MSYAEPMVLGGKKSDGTEDTDSEIAIKKVLQDKRFKVHQITAIASRITDHGMAESRIADHATC